VKDDRLYIVHMLECVERIEWYTQGGRDGFLTDPKTQDAVIRNFEIIGEAAKRVSETTRARAPEIPWSRIAGFRDVLIHQYEGVDLEGVWERVERDMPALKDQLIALGMELNRGTGD
jgi:uncharacterized protein with HEPN domain